MVSTDKAVEPASVMGATKRIAECTLVTSSGGRSDSRVIRLGNVLDSRGSVVPRFRRQIAAGGPVTVTHPEARRFFVTVDDAVDLILRAGRLEGPGVFVPILDPPTTILDLAYRLMREAGHAPDEVPIVFTGLRPGDKISETLVAGDETTTRTTDPRLLKVETQLRHRDLEVQLTRLEDAVARRDATAILELLRVAVPGYQPSLTALEAAGIRPTASVG
jgi:FlaA1/EpsC-like NDP-sugar epimerase